MHPIFTLQYGEFIVADTLCNLLKNCSVFVPASSQEKGIDLLLYQHKNNQTKTVGVQVKMSRSYQVSKKYSHTLWFNRFEPQSNADLFILTGTYAPSPSNSESGISNIQWENIMLAFTYQEMKEFMESVRLKTNPEKYDKMFGFGFNSPSAIFQTRGFATERNMTCYLLKNRIAEIEKLFSKTPI
ncbi:hypothetical protein D7X88_17260 [bacterium C-53]|nr:hypothetical protein [Lachnospiraceae bacterium]NBI04700.1 hypothetical protein [Lachnospiraceae bacterium]RKJ07846.1 hypothetical protein D7X88_17260 [bacterium C-53]